MTRRNPFKRHRFPHEVFLLAVRWYCRYPLSCRDVQDMLAERGITVDASTVHRWVRKFGPESGNGRRPGTTPGEVCNGMLMRPTFLWAGAGATFGEPWISSAS